MTVQKYEANIQYISYISVNTNGDCISSQISRTLFVQWLFIKYSSYRFSLQYMLICISYMKKIILFIVKNIIIDPYCCIYPANFIEWQLQTSMNCVEFSLFYFIQLYTIIVSNISCKG